IELQLYRNGEAYGEAVSVANGTLTHVWSDLDATDAKGVAYTYTVDEVAVPENYTKAISADGLTITNTYEKTNNYVPVKEPDLPNTGISNSNLNVAYALVVGGLILVLKRKKRQIN
ncbi:Cna B-type domain-containing protein, partial [Erysipelothrix aquatica]|uniref:Cna B-type domain-containing protein n=1 Tax=Erysipelothrix aquatica TaxID=2683714 RepID=UPI00135AD00F